MKNTLYYGDNLDILKNYIPSASVDLVYLDPPFNSNANYNIEELLDGQGIDTPPIKQVNQTFKKAPRQKKEGPGQMGLLGDN